MNEVQVQNIMNASISWITCVLLVLSIPAVAKKVDPLFDSDQLMQVTVTGPITRLDEDRDSSIEYEPATLSYNDSNGQPVSIKVTLQSRGNKRLNIRTCRFPPVRILLDKKRN